MATIIENESAWSTTAASNANVDTAINWAEGQDAASVNNSARSQMAARAKARLDQGGALVAAGTGDALTVTTNQVLSAGQLADGQRLLVRAAAPNTITAVTFAPDGLTTAPIKRSDGTALAIGSIKAGMVLDLIYNSGASEWRAVNISPASTANVVITTITGNGTYTATTGMIYCTIEAVGGGGGGGGCGNPAAGNRVSGGGGGGGGYSRTTVLAAAFGASQVVTVGTAGAAGASGPSAGGAGGDTSVGTLCVAKGGGGGGGATATVSGAAGAGASRAAGTGDVTLPGQPGSAGVVSSGSATVTYPAGGGGSSGGGWGAGAPGLLFGAGSGQAGIAYGGGGGGGGSSSTGPNAGGAGAVGVVVITEYC